jgi:hypothetical protein
MVLREMRSQLPARIYKNDTQAAHNNPLQRRIVRQSIAGLLTIGGNCSCLRAKVAHMVGHLPPGARNDEHPFSPGVMATQHFLHNIRHGVEKQPTSKKERER